MEELKKIINKILHYKLQSAEFLKYFFRDVKKHIRKNPKHLLILIGAFLVFAIAIHAIIRPLFINHSYNLGSAGILIPDTNVKIAAKIQYNSKKAEFLFDNGLNPSPEIAGSDSGKITATLQKSGDKKISVTDTTNKVDFSLTPKYALEVGKKVDNHIIYPISDGNGWAVYTMKNTGVKEDIVLEKSNSDNQTFEYKLGLGTGLEARLEKDGSIGVYGNTVLSGDVTASTDSDAALLKKARENAKKDTLIFSIPKPIVIEGKKQISLAKASFSIDGDVLKIKVSNLGKANFPISIDPSIYVVTAQQFMNGNNETNIDFDVDNKLIEKGSTTGARFNTWNSTTSLNTETWRQGVAAAGGFIYTVGGVHPNGGTASYTTVGSDTFTVPDGITAISVKAWGGGGGAGGGGRSSVGAAGGGSGYVETTLSVTPGQVLNIMVGGGGGGGAGASSNAGSGGGGGGYSGILNSSNTPLAIAAGGAGGGGGGYSSGYTGGYGGAGGGNTGVTGGVSGTSNGGIGGSQTSGGNAGTGGVNVGTSGSSLAGGLGGDGSSSSSGSNGSANNGGIGGGGDGGAGNITSRYAGAGGGGSGYFGGGGGAGSSSSTGASGGGGGSGYPSGASTSGSGATPGNSTDADRSNAGDGGGTNGTRTAGSGGNAGIVLISYTGSVDALDDVSWAKFNTTSGTIDSANPGNGTCSGWCTATAYKLPAPRYGLSLVAYNGFLYAIGGESSTCTTANGTGDGGVCKTVYIAKIGANGEPQLWHPTDTNKNNWVYWYRGSDLSTPRSFTGAVAYNNRMYLLGGKTSSSGAASIVNNVQIADVIPTGTLGSWSTSGSTLPYNVYGHGVQVYNDRLYIIGGDSSIGGAPLSSVYYNKINSDGSLNSWIQTSNLSVGRMSNGGNFTAVWGGYIYIYGGCSAVNASGYCTSVESNMKLASINADGSLDVWNINGSVSDARMGQSTLTWRNYIYEIGGCGGQSTSTGICTSALSTINYGEINQDGDASTVAESSASGTDPCSGTDPYGCDLPGTSYIGNMLNITIITNGYLYVIGGCTNNACSTTSGNVAYTAISSTGQMTKPATCPSGTYRGGTWCVDTTHTISGGIAAGSPVVFGGNLYIIGGLNGSANTNTINRTALNADGSISAWEATQSLTGLSMTSVSYTYAYARAKPSTASSVPGNLYVFGGCSTSSSAGCTAYSQRVYKCDIQTAGTLTNCVYNTQLQIGTIPGDSAAGLGIMSGTVYANYIYLIGGVSPNLVDLDTVRYAKFNDNNDIVAVSGSSWIESPYKMAVGRRRADAFGYNGYIYVVGGYDATAGVLPDIEFIKVNVSDGSLGSAAEGFSVSSVTINQRWGLSVPVSNSYAYVIGGCTTGASPSNCTVRTDVIQTFQIYNNDSGAPAGYATSANTYSTSPNRIGASSVILNGYIYVAGGCTSATDCTTATNNVSYASIDANGNIGTWSNTTASLPAVRTWGKLETAGGSLYYIGGQSSTATDERAEVYYATPSSGNVASWGTASKGLPAARTKYGAAVWNNRIYVVGGLDINAADTATVYVSPQLNSGGNITSDWSTSSTSFNVSRSNLTAVAYANNLYLFGGYDGANYLSDVQYTQINSGTGDAGTWAFSTNLHGALADADGFAANGYIYLMGGRSNATSCSPITTIAPVSANTTIASGNNPTGVGEWYETNQRYSGSRYGAATAYYDGKAYIIGGGCGATLTYASPVIQQTTLLSQPQVAKYSIMMDTDSDVFPNYWLLNGVDNSIGARWQLKYRSMTNTTTSCKSPAMTTWGSDTNFGDVALGIYGAYTPKDGSGVTTNCARFYYFNVTVDSSEAFGYPDDVSRGPTITDLTLQFTADPSKRLMHGRTFVGGLQQPIDTPYYTH